MFAKVMKADDKNNQASFKPQYNVPMLLLLCSDWLSQAPNPTGGLYEIGCGSHARTRLRSFDIENSRTASPTATQHVPQQVEVAKATDLPQVTYTYTDRDIILYSEYSLLISH